MDSDLEAIGTNAHELPMVAAALAKDDEELRWAPYRILDQWRQTYGGNLLIALPDAFGTESLPARCAGMGRRLDRLPPRQRAADPGRRGDHRLVGIEGPQSEGLSCSVFSDAMDVGSIEETYHRSSGRGAALVRLGHQPHQ